MVGGHAKHSTLKEGKVLDVTGFWGEFDGMVLVILGTGRFKIDVEVVTPKTSPHQLFCRERSQGRVK